MEIVITSDPDHDDLVAELQVSSQPWAEVMYDRTREAYIVSFVPPSEGEEWPTFDVRELRDALLAAKEALVRKGYPNLIM